MLLVMNIMKLEQEAVTFFFFFLKQTEVGMESQEPAKLKLDFPTQLKLALLHLRSSKNELQNNNNKKPTVIIVVIQC